MAKKLPTCAKCGETVRLKRFEYTPREDLHRACAYPGAYCPGCRVWFPLGEDWRGGYCKTCRSAYNRRYAARRRGLERSPT